MKRTLHRRIAEADFKRKGRLKIGMGGAIRDLPKVFFRNQIANDPRRSLFGYPETRKIEGKKTYGTSPVLFEEQSN